MTMVDALFEVSEAECRARQGAKWTRYESDVLPAFVADMDFATAPAVSAAIRAAADSSSLGYAKMERQQDLFRACSEWMGRRHGWSPEVEQYLALCDVVQGIHIAIDRYTAPGDQVIIQGPIYPPFISSIELNGRTIADNRLIDASGEAALDFDGLRRIAADPRTTLMLLCNPHNPSGRVLTRSELERIAEICLANGVTVVADEIWMDITYPGHPHIPFQTISPEVAAITVTMTSATKSFNLGGIRTAVAIFGSPALKERFETLNPRFRGSPNCLGIDGTIAAWTEGDEWFNAVMRRLDENRQTVMARFAKSMPGVKLRQPEGTYLAWLDCGDLNLERPAAQFILDRARVGLNDGNDFGGDGHCARLNFATTPALLDQILGRLQKVLG